MHASRSQIHSADRLTIGTSLLMAALVGGCAAQTDGVGLDGAPLTIVDRAAFEASEAVAEDALAGIDHDDGTWSYSRPADFDPAVRLRDGSVTWRYVGQHRFPYEGATHSQPAPDGLDELAVIYELRRTDVLGRDWEVEDVDIAAWEAGVRYAEHIDFEPVRPGQARPIELFRPRGPSIFNCTSSLETLNYTQMCPAQTTTPDDLRVGCQACFTERYVRRELRMVDNGDGLGPFFQCVTVSSQSVDGGCGPCVYPCPTTVG